MRTAEPHPAATIGGLALADFDALLARAIEHSLDPVAVLDGSEVIRAWNQAAVELFGYSAREAIGRRPSFLAPDSLAAESDAITASARTGRPVHGLHTIRQRKDGRQIHVALTVSPLTTDQGEVVGMLGTSRDINPMIRVQEQLRDAQRRLNEAQALAHVGSWEWDIGLEFPRWSAELSRIYGYPNDHVPRATDLYSRVHTDDRRRLMQTIDRVRRGDGSEAAYRVLLPDGTVRHVHARHQAQRSAGGEVVSVRGVVQDVTERVHYEAQLRRLATHDPLTGLPNRRTFDVGLERELARSVRERTELCLAVLDIDRFKHINDTFGHQAGDGVLRRIGQLLGSIAREHELLARVGGEEFAWILHGTGTTGAITAVERARACVGAAEFGAVGTVTISAGICARVDGVAGSDLYRCADLALLDAKRAGRDRVVVAAAGGSGPLRR